MTNIYLTFSALAAAEEALKRIWINIVKEEVANNRLAKSSSEVFFDDLAGLDDEAIADLKLCGKINDAFIRDNGTTKAFAVATRCYNAEKWYFPKPDAAYMTDVSGYSEEQYDQVWEYPD